MCVQDNMFTEKIIWVCARYRCSMNLWLCRGLWEPYAVCVGWEP